MIRQLRAVDFRCFAELAVEVPEAGVIFTGENAQGKTSILEAVCLLVRLQSPRTRRLPALARMGGAGGFGVAGEVWGQTRRLQWQRGKMDWRVDGEPREGAGAYLADGGLVVWMGNEDLELVRGGAEGRRRYLDFIGCQVEEGYRVALARYRRALKAKNLLLKDPVRREAEVRSYEMVMADAAVVLTTARARLAAALGPRCEEAQRRISGREEKLEIEYRAAGGLDLAGAIEQVREREWRQRQALVGPHRDDLVFRINGLSASEYASEGQQRTLALALKLGQGRVLEEWRGELPVYLMDDIFGELDPGRRNAVMAELPVAAQKWITTTDLRWMEASEGTDALGRFDVRAGRLGFPGQVSEGLD